MQQDITVKLTDTIDVVYKYYSWKGYETNSKYAELVEFNSYGSRTAAPITTLDKPHFNQYIFRRFGTYSGADGRINNLISGLSYFRNSILPLLKELNLEPGKYSSWVLSHFLKNTYCSNSPYYIKRINSISFDGFEGLDLAHFDINLNANNEPLHDKLFPEVVKLILSINFTEAIALAHIKNYPTLPRSKAKLFTEIEEKKGLITLVKTAKGKKEMQNFVFSTRDSELIQKVIKVYKLDPDTIMDKALKILDGDLISSLYDSISKKKKDEINEDIIRKMPKLINTNITADFLEKLPDIHWAMYGPEPEIGMYYSKESLPESIDITAPADVVKFVVEKVPGRVSAEWMRDYISRFTKKNKEVTTEFFEIMNIFSKEIN